MRKNSLCFSTAIALHRSAMLLERRADRALQQELDLSFCQCMILCSLKNNPDCSQQCIAKCRDLTEAAVSRQIDSLRKKKLIIRRENERNRREHILKLTPKGREVLEQATKLMLKTFDNAFAPVPASDMRRLEKMLTQLLAYAHDADCSGKAKK